MYKKKKYNLVLIYGQTKRLEDKRTDAKKNNFSLSINFLLLGKNILILDPLKHPNHTKCL